MGLPRTILFDTDSLVTALVGLVSLVTFTTLAGGLPPNVHPGDLTQQSQYRALFVLAGCVSISLGLVSERIVLSWLSFIAVQLPDLLSRCSAVPASASAVDLPPATIDLSPCFGLVRGSSLFSFVLLAFLLSVVQGVALGWLFYGVGAVLRRIGSG